MKPPKQLNDFLSQHYTVKVKGGRIIEKPEIKNFCDNPNNYEDVNSLDWINANEEYNNAEEAIKLPTLGVFIKQVEDQIGDTVKEGAEFALVVDYRDFIYQLLTLSMFVPWEESTESVMQRIENPNCDSDHMYNACFDQAQQNVLFEGWWHYHRLNRIENGPVFANILGDQLSFYGNGFASLKPQTISDLIPFGLIMKK